MSSVTVILNAIDRGEADASELLPLVYDELRRLATARMRQEQPGHTLQATALVHEAFLRLIGNDAPTWQNRRHFFGAAALAMQRILVDQARRKQRIRHGGQHQRIELSNMDLVVDDTLPDERLLALEQALAEFERQDPRKAELVRLRYFAGLDEAEAAETLSISRATAARWWAWAKAWLFAHIQKDD